MDLYKLSRTIVGACSIKSLSTCFLTIFIYFILFYLTNLIFYLFIRIMCISSIEKPFHKKKIISKLRMKELLFLLRKSYFVIYSLCYFKNFTKSVFSKLKIKMFGAGTFSEHKNVAGIMCLINLQSFCLFVSFFPKWFFSFSCITLTIVIDYPRKSFHSFFFLK